MQYTSLGYCAPGLLLSVFAAIACGQPATKSVPKSNVEHYAGKVFAEPAAAMLLEEGAGEGPAWHPKHGLLFSGSGGINQFADGKVKAFDYSNHTNGLLFDAKGRLLRCETKVRRITRMDHDGTVTVLSDNFDNRKYNNTNDITVDSQGRIYFSDPRYGSREDMAMQDENGKKIEGVYRIDLDGSTHRVITHEADRPNGVIVTSDDQYLLVADNNNNTEGGGERKLLRFDLNEDGTIDAASKKVLYDWKRGRGPDGMAQDNEGRIYVAGGLTNPQPPHESVDESNRGGVYVFSTDGDFLAFVSIPRDECTNCSFGDEDLETLYVTAGGSLWKIRTLAAGAVAWKK